jgi:hypothetical protein
MVTLSVVTHIIPLLHQPSLTGASRLDNRRIRNSEALAILDRRVSKPARRLSPDNRGGRLGSPPPPYGDGPMGRLNGRPDDGDSWTAHHRGGRILWQHPPPPTSTPEFPWRPDRYSPFSDLPTSAKRWDLCINPLKVTEVLLVGHAKSPFRDNTDRRGCTYTTFPIFPGVHGPAVAFGGETFKPIFTTSDPDLKDLDPCAAAVTAAAKIARDAARKASALASYLAWLSQDPLDAIAAFAAMDLEEALAIARKSRLRPDSLQPKFYQGELDTPDNPTGVPTNQLQDSLKHLELSRAMQELSQALRVADQGGDHLRRLHLNRFAELNPYDLGQPQQAPDTVNDRARRLEASMYPRGRLYDAAVLAATEHFEMCIGNINWSLHAANKTRAAANLGPLAASETSMGAAGYTHLQEQQLASFHRRPELHTLLHAVAAADMAPPVPRAPLPPGQRQLLPSVATEEAGGNPYPSQLEDGAMGPGGPTAMLRDPDTTDRRVAHPGDANPGGRVPPGFLPNVGPTTSPNTMAPVAPANKGATDATDMASMVAPPTHTPPTGPQTGVHGVGHLPPSQPILEGATQPDDPRTAARGVRPPVQPPPRGPGSHPDGPGLRHELRHPAEQRPAPGGQTSAIRFSTGNVDYIRWLLQCTDHADLNATFRLRSANGTTIQLANGITISAVRAATLLDVVQHIEGAAGAGEADGRHGGHGAEDGVDGEDTVA